MESLIYDGCLRANGAKGPIIFSVCGGGGEVNFEGGTEKKQL